MYYVKLTETCYCQALRGARSEETRRYSNIGFNKTHGRHLTANVGDRETQGSYTEGNQTRRTETGGEQSNTAGRNDKSKNILGMWNRKNHIWT